MASFIAVAELLRTCLSQSINLSSQGLGINKEEYDMAYLVFLHSFMIHVLVRSFIHSFDD